MNTSPAVATLKTKEFCREIHVQDGKHTGTFTVKRTVYKRKDGSEYVVWMKRKLVVTREYGHASYEIHTRTLPTFAGLPDSFPAKCLGSR